MYLTIDKKHIILSLVICTILACSIGFVYNNVFAAKGNWGLLREMKKFQMEMLLLIF